MSVTRPGTSVVVALSGGVDSAVAAALLIEKGFAVTGVTMKTWAGEASDEPMRHACYGPGEDSDVEDAHRVAEQLGIPFHVFDLTEEYERDVLEYFRSEYRCGRTPNPCSHCNPAVKFGALADKARQSGIVFERFATGHYAKVEYNSVSRRYLLKRARDASKDQTYFLALLTQDQLKNADFPLADYMKSEVRALAARMGLDVARKAESQDFAAGGHEWLLDAGAPGPILDRNGNRLGEHRGLGTHTVGQRKGLGVASSVPLYVSEIDPERNAIIVGERKDPAATVIPLSPDRVGVEFAEPQLAVAPGQTVVFYEDDVVLGGGTIETTTE
jgi:tRNA-specific 2-thiouridylase